MTGGLDLATANLALSPEAPEEFEAILKQGDPTFRSVMQLVRRRPRDRASWPHNSRG